jgi:molecular chaperone DnaK
LPKDHFHNRSVPEWLRGWARPASPIGPRVAEPKAQGRDEKKYEPEDGNDVEDWPEEHRRADGQTAKESAGCQEPGEDAETHAEEDRKARDLAEARNQAESMCFQLEKLMKENAEKISENDKKPLEDAITKAREAAKGEDVDQIKSAISELEAASHAFSKAMYESTTQASAAGTDGGAPGGETASSADGDDDAIDAEFEVKKD